MTDKNYVLSVWVDARLDGELCSQCGCSVVLDGRRELDLSFSKNAAWSAAAEFTRNRLEQVRQLRDAQNMFRLMCSALAPKQWAMMEPIDKLAKAELAKLTQGMKPEALQ